MSARLEEEADLQLAEQAPGFWRKTPCSHARPLPYGRGSDASSRAVTEAIGATTVREWLVRGIS
jgi:hypothetical protein